MPIIKADLAKARAYVKNFDWSESDALTDDDIARQVAENPDAAPLPPDEETPTINADNLAGKARRKAG